MAGTISSLNPTDKAKLKSILNEAVLSLQRIEDERGALKELIEEVAKKFDIPKKALNKLAQVMFKHNFGDIQSDHEDLEFLYSSIVDDSEKD